MVITSFGLLPSALAQLGQRDVLTACDRGRGRNRTARSPYDAAVEVLDLLSRLVDKSMVSVSREEPEVRYELLQTVREFAGQKLTEAGEANDVHTRHRDFFLRLADDWAQRMTGRRERTTGTGGTGSLKSVPITTTSPPRCTGRGRNGDHDALLRLAAAQWPYWYWGEALGWRHWLPEALDRCDTPSPARVEALIALASLLMRSG